MDKDKKAFWKALSSILLSQRSCGNCYFILNPNATVCHKCIGNHLLALDGAKGRGFGDNSMARTPNSNWIQYDDDDDE